MKICDGNEVMENKARESISRLINETIRTMSKNSPSNEKPTEANEITNEINQTIEEFHSLKVPPIQILKQFITSISEEPLQNNMDIDEIYEWLQKNFTESDLKIKLRLFLQNWSEKQFEDDMQSALS